MKLGLKIVALLLSAMTVMSVSAQEELPLYFDGENAFQHVADHVGVGPRPTASEGSYRAGNLILQHLSANNWTTREEWDVISLGSIATLSPAALQTLEVWEELDLRSLLGMQLDADVPVEVDQLFVPIRNLSGSRGDGATILIGAHYDSRILSDKDPDPERRLLPMPGANDGGSGVGVLLELARVIDAYYTVNQEVRLVFFDAEDNGRIPPWDTVLPSTNGYIVGSTIYANSPRRSGDRIELMLLVDLVGEAEGQRFPIEGYSYQSAPEVAEAIWAIAAELGYEEQFPTEVRSPIIDDHLPFIQRRIPSVNIIDLDYPYWDTSEDTLDKVSAESLQRVGRVVEAYLVRSGAITPR